jgi:hypothetical protein
VWFRNACVLSLILKLKGISPLLVIENYEGRSSRD